MKIAEAIVKDNLAKVLTLAEQQTFADARKQQVSARLTCLSEEKLALSKPKELRSRVQEFVLVFPRSVAIRD